MVFYLLCILKYFFYVLIRLNKIFNCLENKKLNFNFVNY